MDENWKRPLRRLKHSLRGLYDANQTIFHNVVFSLDKDATQLSKFAFMLEPAHEQDCVRLLRVLTPGCATHEHHYFAKHPETYDTMATILYAIRQVMAEIPSGMIPKFRIPECRSPADEDMLRWVSLLYYLAWEYDEYCLQAELEYQEPLLDDGFSPWFECPQPPGCDPRPWLIHQGDSQESILECRNKFLKSGLSFPAMVSAYLTRDSVFIAGRNECLNGNCVGRVHWKIEQ